MPSLHKPSKEAITNFLNSQQSQTFTHKEVGATATTPPPGYDIDHTRILLGTGEQTFLTAKAALQNWTHFNLGWLQAHPLTPTIQVGTPVAIAGKTLGLWWLNACRIIYSVETTAPTTTYGFAYGTLPAHMETGEERFLIEWDPRTSAVHYDILAFSRPHGFLAHLGYPLLRRLQERFRKDSAAAMIRAVTKV